MDLPGRRALMGEEPEPMIVQFRERGGRETRWSRIKARPVREADGTVRLAINVIEDITELKQAEQAQRFLAEASRVLADSLDYEATLTAIANLAVPGVADWVGVDLAGDRVGEVQRVAVAHVDPEKIALAKELAERYPSEPRADRGLHQVLATGESQLWPEIPDALIVEAAKDEEHLRMIRALGMFSAMVVPMRVRERVLGAITFVSAESGKTFNRGHLRLAEDLALRAATAVENARLYSARSAIAQTLQASLLPPMLPEVPGADAGALYQAAGEAHEVGGDFYDLFATTEDHWFAVIGDVCGKGAEAAAVTALTRYTIRAAAARRHSPAAILRWVNEVMLRESSTRFCTVAIAHLDRSRDGTRLTVAVGGHPAPVIARADGRIEELDAQGTLLGLVDDPNLVDVSTELAPGDTVLLYTDGVTEAAAPHRVWTPEDLIGVAAGADGATAQGLDRPRRRRGAVRPRRPAARRPRDARAADQPGLAGRVGVARRGAVLVVGGALLLAARRILLGVALRGVVNLCGLLLRVAGPRFLRLHHVLRSRSETSSALRSAFSCASASSSFASPLRSSLRPWLRSDASSVRSPAAFLTRPLILSVMPMVGTSVRGVPFGLPGRESGQPACSATVRRRSRARRISRETCIWETPTRSAISACVRSSTKRRWSTMRSRDGSACSVGAIVAPYSTSSKRSSSAPIDSA